MIKCTNVRSTGCGTGLTGEKLLKNGHRVVGVDLTPEMIVQLRMKQLAFTALLVGNCEDAHSSKTVAELQVLFIYIVLQQLFQYCLC